MPEQYKGFPEYYNQCLVALFGHPFFEWKLDHIYDLEAGQICETVVNYNVDKTYQLILDHHEPMSEFDSTWKLAPLSCRMPIRNERLQAFNLETNERFIIRRSKLRYIILLSKVEDDFFIPNNKDKILKNWIILPLFTYKHKHTQSFILNDQRLLSPNRFYVPPSFTVGLRLPEESAARYNLIQQSVDRDIHPISALNDALKMQKGIKISKEALKLMVYHYFKNLNILNDLNEGSDSIESQYDVFKSVVNELIDANMMR